MEVMVAMVIMALIGIMAWQGMDAMIRGREGIDRRANQDASYAQLVRQFERDCQAILRRDELKDLATSGSAAPSDPAVVTGSSNLAPLAVGAKNIWWMRRYRADNQDAWMAVGYGMTPAGFTRWTTRPLLRRNEALALWAGVSRDPDLTSKDFLESLVVPLIVRQTFQVQSSIPNSPAIAANPNPSATGSTSATSTNNTNMLGDNRANTSPAVAPANNTPEPQGVTMQWFIQDLPYPITRSCLMGGAL